MDKTHELSSQRKINDNFNIEEVDNENKKNAFKRDFSLKQTKVSHLTISDNKHLHLSNKYIAYQLDTIVTSNQTPVLELTSLKKNLTLENPLSLSSPFYKNSIAPSEVKGTYYSKILRQKKTNEKDNSNLDIFFTDSLPKCILCNRIYPLKMIITTGQCSHLYCQKCIKQLFKQQIYNIDNNAINSFKCPIAGCSEYFQNTTITSILPSIYSTLVTGKGENNKVFMDEVLTIKAKRNLYNKKKSLQYNQYNVIDINSNRKLFSFIKNNEKACPFCSDRRTFNKKATDYYICLNCLKKYCKYCKQNYNEYHFDQLTNKNHCRIYFRKAKRVNKNSKWSSLRKYGIVLGALIMSYFIIHIGFVLSINRLLQCDNSNNCLRKLYRIMAVIMIGIIYLIAFPLFIIILPYYPLFTIL